jgi:CBS domain-containing protein
MTPDPIAMPATAAVADAARTMRDENIGDVIILEEHQMCGIVTDRDIVVGAIALGHDPTRMRLGDVCSGSERPPPE